MTSNIISCENHDLIETCCLYGYRLKLLLKNNRSVTGKALTTITTPDKREFLVLENGEKQHIELNQLIKIHVLTKHAKFAEFTL